MKALQYTRIGRPPEVAEVPDPVAGPGQVVLKVTAAGVCHSDAFVMALPAPAYSAMGFPLPMTLGHEGAGTVHALGAGVDTVAVGDSVAVYGPWGCGVCRNCSAGRENYCTRAAELGIRPPGLGRDGSMAEYLLVDDPRHLVPLGDLDPIANVSLTDAGLTPYHAIKRSLPKLGPGTFAVVIGSGGLGHVAIQILKALSGTQVIVLDTSADKRALAAEVGADITLPSDDAAAAAVREITGGIGAHAVFDIVGNDATLATALAVAAVDSDVQILGIGGGTAAITFGAIAYDAGVRVPYWGYRDELIEVLDLARSGQVSVHTQTYSLDDAPTAYADLAAGQVRGRAVIVP